MYFHTRYNILVGKCKIVIPISFGLNLYLPVCTAVGVLVFATNSLAY